MNSDLVKPGAGTSLAFPWAELCWHRLTILTLPAKQNGNALTLPGLSKLNDRGAMNPVDSIVRKLEKPSLKHWTGRMKRLFPKGDKK